MIEALKSDEIVEKVGGKFKLTALIQRRLGQLMEGARPLVARDGRTDLEIVVEEIMQDKITLEFIDQARALDAKARDAGIDCRLVEVRDQFHAFQNVAAIAPEAARAVGEMSDFVRERIPL